MLWKMHINNFFGYDVFTLNFLVKIAKEYAVGLVTWNKNNKDRRKVLSL